jgi:trans-aconitate 2-methyltransferase
MAGPKASRDWDASTYDQISDPQFSWAGPLVDRLALKPGESVLDAGCGSGRVTALLADLVGPEGRVFAVDVAPSMVEHTRQALGDRVTAYCQDLVELSLPLQVDAIFSNATFHWVMDHPRLFGRLCATLKPGGRLVAQCGGLGNINSFRVLADEVAHEEPFAPYFTDWTGVWNYAGAEETADRLHAAGFVDVTTWLEPKPTPLEDPKPFVRTVCLVRHLDRLPAELHDPFIDTVLARYPAPVVLDYVRLNMTATRPAVA